MAPHGLQEHLELHLNSVELPTEEQLPELIAVRLTFTIFLQPIDIRYNNQLISFRDSKF